MNVSFTFLWPNRILTFRGVLCSSRSISSFVNLESFLCLSNKPEAAYAPLSHDTQNGTCTAPSASDLERSMKSSAFTPSFLPRPLQSRHIPWGSLNEKAFE